MAGKRRIITPMTPIFSVVRPQRPVLANWATSITDPDKFESELAKALVEYWGGINNGKPHIQATIVAPERPPLAQSIYESLDTFFNYCPPVTKMRPLAPDATYVISYGSLAEQSSPYISNRDVRSGALGLNKPWKVNYLEDVEGGLPGTKLDSLCIQDFLAIRANLGDEVMLDQTHGIMALLLISMIPFSPRMQSAKGLDRCHALAPIGLYGSPAGLLLTARAAGVDLLMS